MVEMRWLEKVGYGLTQVNKMETVKTKVLQYRYRILAQDAITHMEWSEWIDVPTVKEGG